ncbi:MAG TPA: GNAT family N-acetyltransferase [Jatrophihabitans sp.]|nr:GNAT family N-acetyltransferase [Jatrophihabitans sp.]
MGSVVLRPFESRHLPLVEPWFADAETQRWLGGPDWPRQMLALATRPLGEFRGASEMGRFRWIGWSDDVPVGYVDAGTFDRWTTWDGERVVGVMDWPCTTLAFVVAPTLRRRGYGTALLDAMLAAPELGHVELFGAGVEPGNVASVGCLLRAGFRALDADPDWEGFVYYVRSRTPP